MSNEELLKRRLCDIQWHEPANRRIMQFYGRRSHWGEKFGAETLGELVRFTPEEVGEWPNIGPATLAAIVATLKELGLSLGPPKSRKLAVEAQLRFPGSSEPLPVCYHCTRRMVKFSCHGTLYLCCPTLEKVKEG